MYNTSAPVPSTPVQTILTQKCRLPRMYFSQVQHMHTLKLFSQMHMLPILLSQFQEMYIFLTYSGSCTQFHRVCSYSNNSTSNSFVHIPANALLPSTRPHSNKCTSSQHTCPHSILKNTSIQIPPNARIPNAPVPVPAHTPTPNTTAPPPALTRSPQTLSLFQQVLPWPPTARTHLPALPRLAFVQRGGTEHLGWLIFSAAEILDVLSRYLIRCC